MKRLLLLAGLALTACAPPSPAVPHLTHSGLTVTVHNTSNKPLTGDLLGQTGPAISVDGQHLTPPPGVACTAESGLRWVCSVPVVKPGGSYPLTFTPDGQGTPALTDAVGLGYLGSPFMTPLPLLR